MAGAFWIKVSTSIWDDEKVKVIDAMPDRDSIMVIWFKLLTQAGKCNEGGRLQLTDYIPLDAELLAGIFNRPREAVERALELFGRFGMVEIDEMQFPYLPNWHKYQNEDALDKLRDARDKEKAENRRRVAEYRARKKAKAEDESGNITVTVTGNGHKKEKENKEIDTEEIKPLPGDNPPAAIPFKEILDYLNTVCGTAFKASAEGNKKWIRARWNEGHRVDDFKRVIDNKYADWHNKPDQIIYLRPETLFGNKFDGYLNQRKRGGGPSGRNDGGADYSEFME